MGLSIANNLASLRAQAEIQRTTGQLNRSFERLSSGLRINGPQDDPAGIQVADALRADTALATVAIRNANDGISHVSIADAGMGEISNILTRMAELAEQSANGVITNSQRSALSSEFIALGSEIQRIAEVTTFNDRTLLSNSSTLTLQVGLDSGSNSQITIAGVTATLSALGLAASGGKALVYSIISTSETGAQSAAQNALNAVNNAINSLSASRGNLGASASRLEIAVEYLTVVRENFVAAESRIRDADVAFEVAEMVRLQVLQQAGIAVLAQANQQPGVALSLLQAGL